MSERPPLLRGLDEDALLYRICRQLDASDDAGATVVPVLAEIGRYLGEGSLALSLWNRDTGHIEMEVTHGLSPEQKRQGRFRAGEGITGRVFEEGVPAVVADVRADDSFLNRTSELEDKAHPALVCVPVKLEGRVIGTLSALWEPAPGQDLQALARLFAVIASLIAGPVRYRQIAEEKQRLESQLVEKYRPKNIVGNAKAMQQVYRQIAQVARSNATVLLRGESGVGKELVASAIHYSGPRANRPFIKVNCAALPENILESELFGHEMGAFTGAIRRRTGRFEQADGGTLFLDEIGDFSPAIQVRLLRALQEREFQRVGGDRDILVDVRIIAATNRDLEALMAEEIFRADLYYRLNVFPIHIPALRERKEDINLLADYFVQKYNKAGHKKIRRITTPALNALMTYPWPGHVRELQNCIERAILVSEGGIIQARDLPPSLQTAATSNTRRLGPLQAYIDSLEREMITDAIIEARGNMARAARALGISERMMGLRVAKYKINPKSYL